MLNKNPTGKKLKLDKWEDTIYITLNCVQYASFPDNLFQYMYMYNVWINEKEKKVIIYM
jgi:hypothetical protein